MTSNRFRMISMPFFAAMLAAPVLVNCGKLGNMVPGGKCDVDVANIDAIAKADWAATLKVDAKIGAQIKGGLQAALNLKNLAAEIDGQLKVACNGLAKDLGAPEGKDAQEAGKGAMKVMGEVKAKMGANIKIALDFQPPKCSASMSAMADCSGKCDVQATGGKAEVKCEGGEISGTCDAKCEGSCELEAGAKCEGECGGSCGAEMKGTCNGTCDGKCDGKDSKGAECKGTCEGKCSGEIKGECKGECKGGCQLKAGGSCKGSCSGKCSVEMKAPKCSGKLEPPKVSAECKASCDAQVSGKVECTPVRVGVKVEGSADASAQAKFEGAIKNNLGGVIKIAVGMKDRLEGVAASGKAVIDGVQAAAKAGAKGGAQGALKITACIAAPFSAAFDAVASVKANVNVSVDVKASASASGSAKAGG
ncbi:MAG: hypothetical protein MUF64_27775 [Polyangiaceae bacterium]|jgi:hypothetical protein|nr:hypothetical protein [Polyangiaceae bacterium]